VRESKAADERQLTMNINNAYIFLGFSALLVGYILYTMIRPRKGLRQGDKHHEVEL